MTDMEELAAAWQIGVDTMAARMETILMIIAMSGIESAKRYVQTTAPLTNPYKS